MTFAAVVPTAVACSVVDNAEGGNARTCSSTFTFGPTEQLGSMSKFNDRAIAAGKEQVPISLRALTEAAGWQPGWDRVIEVPAGISETDLERRVGADGVCWKALPKESSSDGPTSGFYLFLQGNVPVQSTTWYEPTRRPIDFDGRDQILADTPLVGSDAHRLRPQE